MTIQSIGFSEWPNPEQPADTADVDQQMQRFLKFQSQFGKPFQRENVSTGIIGVATVAEALQLLELRWTQSPGSPCQMSLSQGLISQAPAARRPSESPGSRVR